jgi:outer membrane lipoprotein-sorting protein
MRLRRRWGRGAAMGVCVALLTVAATPAFPETGTIPAAAGPAGADAAAGSMPATDVSASDLVAGALDLVRGRTSYTELTMVIHRPDWERTSTLVSWTRGREDALIRFTAPARDAGNATLKQGDNMWTYTPKLNKTIRLPFSLMSQSWAGSDFSYNDLSRTDDLLRYYELSITAVAEEDGHRVYTIEAIPHDDAPVVWGKEEWVLRDDYVLVSQTFYDQSLEPLKRLETRRIGELGGRVMPLTMRMGKLETPDEFTEVTYEAADFDIELPDRTFTVFNLQSGGRR